MNLKIRSTTLREALNVDDNINELSDDEINAIKELRLAIENDLFDRIGNITFEQEISAVLPCLPELKRLIVINRYYDIDDRLNIKLNNGVTDKLEVLQLIGIDLSQTDLVKFFIEHKNLSNVRLINCNISNLSFLNFLPQGLKFISLSYNPIPKEYADYILRLRQESLSALGISGCNDVLKEYEKKGYEFSPFLTKTRGKLTGEQFYEAYQRALISTQFTINDMVKLDKYIDFFSKERSKEQRDVYIDDFDEINYFDDIENIEQNYIDNINLFARGENTTLNLTPEIAQKLKGKISKEIRVQLLIKNASELSVNQLDELNKEISLNSIKINDVNQSLGKQQTFPYDVKTYRECRKKIDELLQGINLNTCEPNRDKKIFGKVIKRLANHMSFDYSTLKKEAAKEEVISETISCRNMEGGLINNTCVCAGFTEIVRNVFACCGIDSLYIYGKNTKNNKAHAWNQIKLDGQWYNLDFTWDRDAILSGKQTKYTLKSDQDFGHAIYDTSRSIRQKCNLSLGIDELKNYIYGKGNTELQKGPMEDLEEDSHDDR